MLKQTQKIWYMLLLIAGLSLTFLSMFFILRDHSLFSFINALSVISIFYIIIGCSLWVIGGGFFSGIIYGFKRYMRVMRKRKIIDQEEHMQDEDLRPPSETHASTFPFIVTGIVLFLISLSLSFWA